MPSSETTSLVVEMRVSLPLKDKYYHNKLHPVLATKAPTRWRYFQISHERDEARGIV